MTPIAHLSCLVPAVFLLATSATQAAIPIADGAGSHEDYNARRLELYQQWLCEPYRQRHPVDSDEDHADALTLLEEIAHMQVNGGPAPQAHLDLRGRVKMVRERAGDDALLLFADAYAWDYFASTAADKYAKAADAIIEQEYPLPLAAMAYRRSTDNYRSADRVDEAREQLALARDTVLAYLREHPADVSPRLTLNVILGPLQPKGEADEGLEAFDAHIEAVREIDGLDPWLAEMVAGRSALARAWHIRGSGFAHTVDPDSWPQYRKDRARAEEHLKAAHALRPDRPEAASDMVKASWGRVNDPIPERTPRYWFDRAVTAEFDWVVPYRRMSWALLPRWGGDHQQGIAFARECAATGRYDTPVPYHAIDAVREILRVDFENDYQVASELGVFDLVEEVLRQYVEQAEGAGSARSHCSELLMFACLADKAEVAREVWNTLDGAFDPSVVDRFRGIDRFEHSAIDATLAKSGPAATLLADANDVREAGDHEQALALYDEAWDAAGDDLPSHRFIERQRLPLRWQRSKQTGEWLTLRFSEGLPGWVPRFGSWTPIDEQTVEGHSAEQGLMLQLPLDLGDSFELRGEIEFVERHYPKYFSAGVLLYDHRREPRWMPSLFHGLLLFRDRETLARFDLDDKAVDVADAAVGDVNHFHLRVEGDEAVVHINDAEVWRGAWFGPDDSYLANPWLGLGGHYWYEGATLRFANIELRALQP